MCPEHPKETMIGNLKTKRAENVRRLFDDPVFVEALAKMVEKANTCKKTCPWFRNCKGGCLFETDCENKKTAYQAAAEDIKKMIQEKTDLSTVPKYKEQSVIYALFSRKK